MRATNDSDDINSILKSPCIKAQQRKKRRKRSSWASGVIKKTKRSSEKKDEDQEKVEEEVEEKTEQLSIEMTNETSNDSNKENQPQSPEITTTPVIEEQQQQGSMEVATVENRPITPPPSPGKCGLLHNCTAAWFVLLGRLAKTGFYTLSLFFAKSA